MGRKKSMCRALVALVALVTPALQWWMASCSVKRVASGRPLKRKEAKKGSPASVSTVRCTETFFTFSRFSEVLLFFSFFFFFAVSSALFLCSLYRSRARLHTDTSPSTVVGISPPLVRPFVPPASDISDTCLRTCLHLRLHLPALAVSGFLLWFFSSAAPRAGATFLLALVAWKQK